MSADAGDQSQAPGLAETGLAGNAVDVAMARADIAAFQTCQKRLSPLFQLARPVQCDVLWFYQLNDTFPGQGFEFFIGQSRLSVENLPGVLSVPGDVTIG